MEQQPRRFTADLLYLGGATVVALVVGTMLMQNAAPPKLADAKPSPSASPTATPVQTHPVKEPDNCPACGMAVRTQRDQDFIQRTQQQQQQKPQQKS